jgi:hypothetical protein
VCFVLPHTQTLYLGIECEENKLFHIILLLEPCLALILN